jgi:hypothetical protein
LVACRMLSGLRQPATWKVSVRLQLAICQELQTDAGSSHSGGLVMEEHATVSMETTPFAFSDSELRRLAAYRAAVLAGFYTDRMVSVESKAPAQQSGSMSQPTSRRLFGSLTYAKPAVVRACGVLHTLRERALATPKIHEGYAVALTRTVAPCSGPRRSP